MNAQQRSLSNARLRRSATSRSEYFSYSSEKSDCSRVPCEAPSRSHVTWLEGEVTDYLKVIDSKLERLFQQVINMGTRVDQVVNGLGPQCQFYCAADDDDMAKFNLPWIREESNETGSSSNPPLPPGDISLRSEDACPRSEENGSRVDTKDSLPSIHTNLYNGKSKTQQRYKANTADSFQTGTFESLPNMGARPSGLSHVTFSLEPACRREAKRKTRDDIEAALRETLAEHAKDCSEDTVMKKSTLLSAEDLQNRVASRSWAQRQLFYMLEDPDSHMVAWLYEKLMPFIILTSFLFALAQTLDPPPLSPAPAALVEIAFETLFAVECTMRFVACPNKKLFFKDYNNIFDLLAVLPIFFHVLKFNDPTTDFGSFEDAIMSFVPGLRVLKTLRKFEKFQLLVDALELAVEGLPVCLFTLLVLTLTFSALIFLAEPRSNIGSLQQAMWLCINLQTMVGYPNITPVSTQGSMVVTALIIVSVLYLAMPLGIIGNAFADVWQQRQLRILCHRTRARMTLWGFGPQDIAALFLLFDTGGQGELNQQDFVNMVSAMGLGLKDSLAVDLFGSLDVDGSGAIDDKEFVAAVFPHDFDTIYGDIDEAETGEGDAAEPSSPTGSATEPTPLQKGSGLFK